MCPVLVQMQGLPGRADQPPPYGQQLPGAMGMAGAGLPGGAQAQLEALLGISSQLGLGNGTAADLGTGTWSTSRGLPGSGLTSPQVRPQSMFVGVQMHDHQTLLKAHSDELVLCSGCVPESWGTTGS